MEEKREVMDEIKLMRSWSDWQSGYRARYLEAIIGLPDEERHKDRGASYPSVQNIFEHIIGAHLYWYEGIVLNWKVDVSYPEDRELNAEELRSAAARADKAVKGVMDMLSPETIGKRFVVEGETGGKKFSRDTCLADIVWHILEEQTQHIGELNALFWQMDREPPLQEWFSSSISMSR